jgi:alkylated DNA repair dioxygenase AlkB
LANSQADLFGGPPLPQGFGYMDDLVSVDEERKLSAWISSLELEAFEFHGFTGKRRVISFGWKYDFSRQRLDQSQAFPALIEPIRDRAAGFAKIAPSEIVHMLVTEYGPGAGIGWHKDKAVFDEVIGISLGSACELKLRRANESGWQRASVPLQPRSAYLLSGEARSLWEHSIPPIAALRQSITFRTLAGSVSRL